MQITRVEATPKSGEGLRDVRGDVVRRRLKADHNLDFTKVRSIVGFLINSDIDATLISERADDLFADPIIEFSTTNQTFLQSNNIFVFLSIVFLPTSSSTSWKSIVMKITNRYGESGQPCLMPVLCFLHVDFPSMSFILNLGLS